MPYNFIIDAASLSRIKIIPLHAVKLEWAGESHRFELVEEDSALAITAFEEPNDRGGNDETALMIQGTAVIMFNSYEDPAFRTLRQRIAAEVPSRILWEVQALAEQEAGATAHIYVDAATVTVCDESVTTGIEWIPTERPRLSIRTLTVCSIDVLDDHENPPGSEDYFSKWFHQISGY